MTTLASLDAKSAAQMKALDAPRRLARGLILSKTADARAHGLNALTERAKDAPDGRATVAMVRRSRSTDAALARLAELATSLVAMVADWRETAYRDAFAWWEEHLPAEVLKADPKPTQANVSAVRGVVLHGMPVVTEVAAATRDAGRRLRAVLAQAATRSLTGRDSADLVKGWERRTTAALIAVADRLLSDSQVVADRKAGRDCCRPEMLHPDPTLP